MKIVPRGFLHGLVLSLFCFAFSVGAQEAQHWVASWGASQQIPEPRNALSVADMTDATIRQIVHLTLGGQKLRVRLSNAFGTAALHLAEVHSKASLACN
jgi:hypothetical protein